MEAPSMIRNLALPAKVYLGLALLSILGTLLTSAPADKKEAKAVSLVIQVIAIFIWTWIINLVAKRHMTWAWVLALLPIILIGIMLLVLIGAIALQPLGL